MTDREQFDCSVALGVALRCTRGMEHPHDVREYAEAVELAIKHLIREGVLFASSFPEVSGVRLRE